MRMQPESKARERFMMTLWCAVTVVCLALATLPVKATCGNFTKCEGIDRDAGAFLIGQRDAFRRLAGRHVPLVVSFTRTGYWFCATDDTLSGDGEAISYDRKMYVQRCVKPIYEWGE